MPWFAHLVALGVVVVILPLIGGGIIALADPLINSMGVSSEHLGVAVFVGVLLLYSPVFTVVGMAAAIPLAWLALRTGRAGWASAALAGALVGFLLYAIPGGAAGAIGAGFGTLFGLVYWIVLRLLGPRAFDLPT